MKIQSIILGGLCVLFLCSILSFVDACSDSVCGPIVSKCMLIKSCDCDTSNKAHCDCCKNCSVCLDAKYTECCSCVGLCDSKNNEEYLGNISSVGDLKDPIPDLFDVLTDEEDPAQRWTSYTFLSTDVKPGKNIMRINGTKVNRRGSNTNCTVAFMAECMSMQRCQDSCKSLGASIYRWFHGEGCCECVGHSCLGYGLNEPNCENCSERLDLEVAAAVYSRDLNEMEHEREGKDGENIQNMISEMQMSDMPVKDRKHIDEVVGKNHGANLKEEEEDEDDDEEEDEDELDELDKEIENDEDDKYLEDKNT